MIKFCGEISGKCKEYQLKAHQKKNFILMLIPCLVILIFLIIFGIKVHMIFIIAGIPGIIALLLISLIKPSRDSYPLMFPDKIIINEDTVETESDKFYHCEDIKNAVRVVDYGEWYQIFFSFSLGNGRFICKKDLIVEGTIEEFEKIFEDKIERKIIG